MFALCIYGMQCRHLLILYWLFIYIIVFRLYVSKGYSLWCLYNCVHKAIVYDVSWGPFCPISISEVCEMNGMNNCNLGNVETNSLLFFFLFFVDIQTMAKDLEYLNILIPIVLFIFFFLFPFFFLFVKFLTLYYRL